MEVTQYIGARYVPKFFENSDGTHDWRSGVMYEPLTIVIYNTNSYTSKKPVPASVGNPSDNPEYWAATGMYNAQVEDLTLTVDALDDRVEAIETELKSCALYVGNSYTSGTGSSDGRGIYARTRDLFDETYVVYGDGIGFDDYDGDHETFESRVRAAVENNSVPTSKITDVVVISAWGDSRSLAAGHNVDSAMSSFFQYVRSVFPNLRNIYLTLGEGRGRCDYSTNYLSYVYDVHKLFINNTLRNNVRYLGWIGWELMYDLTVFSNDTYHPNNAGYDILEGAFRDAWQGHLEYKPKTARDAVDASSIIEGLRFYIATYAHPDRASVSVEFGSTSNIPATFTPIAQYASIHFGLPSAVVPNINRGAVFNFSCNMKLGGGGKELPMSLAFNNTGGSYGFYGNAQFSTTGNKSDLSASSNFDVNKVLLR